MVLFSGTVVTGLTALEHTAAGEGIVPVKVIVGGLLASAVLMALADLQGDLAFGLAITALLAAVLVPGRGGQSRVDLFRRIGGKI